MSTVKYIFLGILILVLGRLTFFTDPYAVSVDESTYMALAERADYAGHLYAHAVDRKPPFLLWSYEAIQKIFGTWNIHGVHFIAILWTLALGFMAARLTGTWAAFFIYLLYSSSLPRGVFAFNAELLMLLPLVLSILCLEKAKRSVLKMQWAWVFLSVFLAGQACYFKQYAGLIYAPFYLWWAFSEWKGWRRHLALGILSAFSLSLSLGWPALYYWRQGAFEDFLYWVWLDGFAYMGQEAGVLNEERSLLAALGGVVLAWIPLWLLVFKKMPYLMKKYFPWVLLAAFAGYTAFMSGRYYTHYFIPLIYFLSLLGAFAWQQEGKIKETWKKMAMGAALSVPFIVFAIFNVAQDRFHPNTSFNVQALAKVKSAAEQIRMMTAREDRIQVWGMASQIYVLSERGSSTSFIFSDFVSGRLPGFRSSASIPIPGMEERFLREMAESPPRIFVDTSTASLNDYGDFPLSRFPQIESFILKNFEKYEGQSGEIDIWVYSGLGLK